MNKCGIEFGGFIRIRYTVCSNRGLRVVGILIDTPLSQQWINFYEVCPIKTLHLVARRYCMVPTQGGVSFPLEWFILLFVITSRYYV